MTLPSLGVGLAVCGVLAFDLNLVLGMIGVPELLTKFVIGMQASQGQIIMILTVLYLILE